MKMFMRTLYYGINSGQYAPRTGRNKKEPLMNATVRQVRITPLLKGRLCLYTVVGVMRTQKQRTMSNSPRSMQQKADTSETDFNFAFACSTMTSGQLTLHSIPQKLPDQ